MDSVSLQVCNTFLSPFPQQVKQSLLLLLPQKAQETLQQLPHPGRFQKEVLSTDFLDKVHFSWLAPYLRTLSKKDLPLFLAALSPWQKEGLQPILGYSNGLPSLEPITRNYLRANLRKTLSQNQTFLPLSCLPNSPLNRLLCIEKQTLPKFLSFLGLHDLSLEMRQIISTKTRKQIYQTLTKDEGDYLNRLTLYQEPLVFKRLFLKNWDGSNEEMRKLLIERGIHRLSHALYFACESLAWYVCRRLDMYLGALILKHKEKPTHAKAEELLHRQIDQILSLLTPSQESP